MILSELITDFVNWTATFITPDWGELVLLIPIGLAVLVFLFVTWTAYRFATAGPKRRGFRRQPPRPPEGIHMPGPSFAPVLAAIGAFFLVFGMATGGFWLLVGALVLVVTLLYWGREALRDYDAIGASGGHGGAGVVITGALPSRTGPVPDGIHMPPPSFRPVLVALAATILVGAMVVGSAPMLLLGFAGMAIALVGWLKDARREYRAVEKADRTGHLDLGGSPAWPTATLAALLLLVAAGLLLGTGAITGSSDATSGAGASPAASSEAGTGASAEP